MEMPVIMTGINKCMFGVAPTPFVVLPLNLSLFQNLPGGTIMDNIPFLNIMPFGMCMSLANPMVVAATAAAFGVLTPMPCIPVIASPWTPLKPTVLIKGKPILSQNAMVMCNWGGMIKSIFPGVSMCTI